MSDYPFFATAPKAMAQLLAEELHALGAEAIKPTVAGVAFRGTLATAYRICLWSRIANRVLLTLATFAVDNRQDLYQGVYKINWFEHIGPQATFAVTGTVKNAPAVNNSHFAALTVKDAIVDQMRAKFNKRPSIDTERPDLRVNIHLQRDQARLSLDLSGTSLHQRGYRDITLQAPLKENLAAAILLRAGWPKIAARQGALLDPMCGSGTLLLEGAMIAADYAPGLLRDYYGFLGWKQHDAACWQTLLEEAQQRKAAGLAKLPPIVGFDHSRRSVAAALHHSERAGLQQKIHIERRDISAATPAANWPPGLVICNPPYGERLGDEAETVALYQSFGEILKDRFVGWQAAIIVSDPELGFRLGIRSQKPVTFYNGALECKLLRLSLQADAFFVPKAKTPAERLAAIHRDSRQPIDDPGADMFANRLRKNLKQLSRWAETNNISCYRLYDADLPEYAVAIDLYRSDGIRINVQEYEPPQSVDPHKADHRLACILAEIRAVFNISEDRISLKIRRKQKSTDQYQKQGDQGAFHIVEEGGCKLLVNFDDYLDTGLFLDHRPLRLLIQQQADGKRFLNLFAYTGSATVHAAVGGARSTTSVDLSQTYLDWARRNLSLNPSRGEHELIRADCLEWLENEAQKPQARRYDLIFLDPPTFSNSKRMTDAFDVQRDHVALIKHAAELLAPGGVLYFSTNFRRFKLDTEALSGLRIDNITASTVPRDFARNPKIHYCWSIQA